MCIFLYENTRSLIQISRKCIPKVPIETSHHSGYGLAPTRQQATTWTDEGLIYWHIYASLDLEDI